MVEPNGPSAPSGFSLAVQQTKTISPLSVAAHSGCRLRRNDPGRRVYRRIALNPVCRCKPSGTHPENSSPTDLTDRDFAGEQVVRG